MRACHWPLTIGIITAICINPLPFCSLAQTDPALAGASRPKPQLTLNDRDRQYKRFHQFALRSIVLLRYEAASAFLSDHLSDHPDDAESLYLMGIWHARQAQTREAARWFGKAIEAGLPPGRIVAGPRGLLRGLDRDHEFFAELWKAYRSQAVHGPLLGNVTDQSASFWVRTAEAAAIRVIASPSASFAPPVLTANGQTQIDNDHTGIIRLSGLSSDTRYYYRLEINGTPQPPEPQPPRSGPLPRPVRPVNSESPLAEGLALFPLTNGHGEPSRPTRPTRCSYSVTMSILTIPSLSSCSDIPIIGGSPDRSGVI